jgi:hypothetical protein
VQISTRGGHCSFKSADIIDFIGFADGNVAASPLLDAAIASDPVIYMPPVSGGQNARHSGDGARI